MHDDVEAPAARAEALVQLGELSAARQAIEGASVAPGNTATLAELQNPQKRPPILQDPIPADLVDVVQPTPSCLIRKASPATSAVRDGVLQEALQA